ncbi:MAG: hypothetical protein WCJ58_02940 [bacterium]
MKFNYHSAIKNDESKQKTGGVADLQPVREANKSKFFLADFRSPVTVFKFQYSSHFDTMNLVKKFFMTEFVQMPAPKHRGLRLFILALILLLFCSLAGIAIYIIQLYATKPDPVIVDRPEEIQFANPSPTLQPTPEFNFQEYQNWQEYVFSDCRMEFYAPMEWKPGLRGANNACGVLYVNNASETINFDNIQGMKFVVAKIGSGFTYDFATQSFDPTKYVQSLNTVSVTGEKTAAIVAQDQYFLKGLNSKHLKLTRQGLGTADYLFYQVQNNWYVIVWGGSSVKDNAADIDKLFLSIRKN